jgi:hypothetical protein
MKTKLPPEIDSIDEILGIWKANREMALESLESVTPSELTMRPEGGWSLSEVGEHLYMTQWNVGRMIPGLLAGKFGSPTGEQLDLDFRKMRVGLARPTGFKNPENLAPLHNYSLEDLRPLLEKSEKKLFEAVQGKPKADLQKRGVEHPAFGLLNLFNFLWVMALHEGLHAFAIKERVSRLKRN